MDAELLARETLGWDRARFLAHATDAAPASFLGAFPTLLSRRARREPVSEILGRREFWGLDFEVTRDVLTPRPETELILEEAVSRLAGRTRTGTPPPPDAAVLGRDAALAIVDVGTGTGCLAVCLAHEFPNSTIVATDISPAALALARRNADRHQVRGRIEFRLTSLLDGIAPPFDLVVSNPPYVKTADLPGLPPEVRDYEPREALDGGPDGLDVIRRLLTDAAGVLRPGGWAMVEFGFGQEAGVQQAVAAAGLDLVAIRPDLQGIPRTVVARK